MKNLVVSVLALIAFGQASQALASAEMPMFYKTGNGSHGNLAVARLIQDSLTRHPDGTGYIQGTPCLTPAALLEAIHRNQPSVRIERVSDLPGLFRSLIPHRARQEGFTQPVVMSRMVCAKPGSLQSGDHLDSMGWPREFRDEEIAYFLPNHTQPFSAQDCENIVGETSPPPPPPPILPPPPPQINPDCAVFYYSLDKIPAGATNVRILYEYAGKSSLAPSACHFKGKVLDCTECNPLQSAEQDAIEYAESRGWHMRFGYHDYRYADIDMSTSPTPTGLRLVLSPEAMGSYGAIIVCPEFDYKGVHYVALKSKTFVLNPRDPNRRFKSTDFDFVPSGS